MKSKKVLFLFSLICIICSSFPLTVLAEGNDYIVEKVEIYYGIGENGVDSESKYTITNDSSADISSLDIKIPSPSNVESQEVSFINETTGNELSFSSGDNGIYHLDIDAPFAHGESITISIRNFLNYNEPYQKTFDLSISLPSISGSVKMPQTKDSCVVTVKLPEDWAISSSFPTVYLVDKSNNEYSASLSNVPGIFQAKLITEPGGIRNDTLINIAFPSLLLIGAGVVLILLRVQIKHKKLDDQEKNQPEEKTMPTE